MRPYGTQAGRTTCNEARLRAQLQWTWSRALNNTSTAAALSYPTHKAYPQLFYDYSSLQLRIADLADIRKMGWEHTAIFTIAALFLHSMSLVIYRICLSPIANVPGPKLAAATFWYEFYYDVIKQGRYTWKIKELHEQYGKL